MMMTTVTTALITMIRERERERGNESESLSLFVKTKVRESVSVMMVRLNWICYIISPKLLLCDDDPSSFCSFFLWNTLRVWDTRDPITDQRLTSRDDSDEERWFKVYFKIYSVWDEEHSHDDSSWTCKVLSWLTWEWQSSQYSLPWAIVSWPWICHSLWIHERLVFFTSLSFHGMIPVRMSDWEDRDHHPVSPYILPQRMAWLRL